MATRLAIVTLAVAAPTTGHSAEYLTKVTSPVYEAQGSPKDLATRARTCISQHLAAGTTDSILITSSDLDGGVIVARSALKYPDGLMNWEIRSTFTFEAREGRFRIDQTNLERFNGRAGGWGPIGKWTGSGWKKAEERLVASAAVVAECVRSEPRVEDW